MADITPATRIEKAISDATEITPATRIEKFIANISGADYELTPATRIEKLLDDAAGSSGSGEWTTDGIANQSEPAGDLIINTDTIGGYAFSNRSAITSVYSDTAETVLSYAFSYCNGLRIAKLSTANSNLNISDSSVSVFFHCIALEMVILPVWKGELNQFFTNDSALRIVDLGERVRFTANCFAGCTQLETLILRSSSLCAATVSTALNLSSIAGATSGLIPKVYVPNDLISTYQTASNWKTHYNNGTVDFVAIEGSEYENYYADGTPVT